MHQTNTTEGHSSIHSLILHLSLSLSSSLILLTLHLINLQEASSCSTHSQTQPQAAAIKSNKARMYLCSSLGQLLFAIKTLTKKKLLRRNKSKFCNISHDIMKTNIKFKFEEFRRGTLGNIHEIKMSRDGELRQRDTEGPYEISFLKQTSTETQEFCLLLYLQDFHLEFTDNSLLFTPTGDIQRAFRFCTKTTHHYNRQVWRGPIEDTYKGQFALCNFLKDGATKKLYV